MKATHVVVTGANEVELQDLEIDSESLEPHQVLIETECSFISAGTELANYTAVEPLVRVPGSWCCYPYRPGYGNVGIVRATGSAVTAYGPGRRVFSHGGHAAFVIVDLETELLIEVPEALAPDLAAASRMAGVSLTALVVAELVGNPWVVVYGLGPVGNLAAQAFGIRGCRVIGVDPVGSRRDLARTCGIEQVIGGESVDVPAEIESLTGGRLAAVTVDSVGHSAVAIEALAATADYGQLILLGSPRASVETDITRFLSDVHLRGVVVRGALEWRLPMYDVPRTRGFSQFSKQQMIFDWVADGRLDVASLVSHRMKPEQIKDAYEGLLKKPGTYTGVVLDWK
ncbi:MAG: zinc-binding alcohol dehydrogenase [Lentisphaeria bacterium]|jgi:threonine dehydrogenase-like Zn-dependent dehydrogenase|nr:zinc-binding alcohol dehydrogenase [Lentisphaeria bacterium]MDP7740121.1 zinc-binding alcohol dehydrogenase [Lentisphaeria bacterium]